MTGIAGRLNAFATRLARRLYENDGPPPGSAQRVADRMRDTNPWDAAPPLDFPVWAGAPRRITLLLPPRSRKTRCGCMWFAGGWYSPCLGHDHRIQDSWRRWKEELAQTEDHG